MSSKSDRNMITVLALALGFTMAFAIQPKTAQGLNGPMISYGQNPRFSTGGVDYINSTGINTTILTAPSDQDFIITDLNLGNYHSYGVKVVLSSGSNTLGAWHTRYDENVTVSLKSGLVVPAGQSLQMEATRSDGGTTLAWTISGYYAKP